MLRISVVVENEVVVDRLLEGIEERALDLRPVWADVLKVFQGIVAKAFATEGASTGAPWPQLAPSTQAERGRLGYGAARPILERTGKLKRALTIGEGAYLSSQPTRMSYQLSGEVAHYHYHQSAEPRRRLPRRAPVLLTADDRTALMHPVRLYITGRDVAAPQRTRVG